MNSIFSAFIVLAGCACAWAGGLTFSGDELGNISAVSDDVTLWLVNYSSSGCVGSPAMSGDVVISSHLTGVISCINVLDGSLLWQFSPANDGLYDSAVIGGGKVFAALMSGSLIALDINNGRILWRYQSSQGLRTSPAYYDGLVLLGEYDGRFSIIDAQTGNRLNGGGAGGPVNTPAVSDGVVYYSSWDGSVHAVRLVNVIPLWNVMLPEPLTTPPLIHQNAVILGSASGTIFALNKHDGSIIWQYYSEGGTLKLSILDGSLSVITDDGRSLLINPLSGLSIY